MTYEPLHYLLNFRVFYINLIIIISGQSNLTKDCIAAADGRFSRIRQVATMCFRMWTSWHHLANTIEFVLPSAHPSPQSKRQIDRFSSAVLAQLTAESPYTYNGLFFPPKLSLPMKASGIPSNTWPTKVLNPHNQFIHFCIDDRIVSLYFTMGSRFSPSKLPLPMGDLNRHLTHDSLAHPSPQSKWHLDRFSRFCRADRPTDRQTDQQTTLLRQ